jgi:nucleoside-diphosphate-sugar epimerase
LINVTGKRVALIGGAGFIGHNLALALKARGAEVVVIDGLEVNNLLQFAGLDDPDRNPEFYLRILGERLRLLREARVAVHVQDARDYHKLSHILAEIKPQAIYHLAAVSHADRSNKDPFSTFDHSLRTLENALDWARGAVEHFVYFSSSMVYGNFPAGEVTEQSPCDPLGIYGALKYAGEKIVIAYNQVFNLPYTIIRPSALYGERCVSRRVSQIFIENALQGKEITVHGSGEDSLDFTYIDDLVQGLVGVLEHEAARNQTFNLTYGEARTIGEMAGILKAYFPEVRIRYVPRDRLTPARGTLCVDKARRLLGYAPRFPLEKGYARYIGWYRNWYRGQYGGGQARTAA